MYGLKKDWEVETSSRAYVLDDYCAAEPRWCPGCGDHSVLNAVQRLARERQMPPEQTVVVSGIGCSSRFPHYMKTYGFHGLHGRALPVACGVRSRRPDLNLFVVTGDGDCCAIGMGHWVHAMRYNMDMTILLLDNHIYGLTKNQTSPTTGKGSVSNTHPQGSFFVPLNPITLALGISNVSFVAQSVDWNPPHVYATIRAAHDHKGTSFVRIFQRCPHFTRDLFAEAQKDPSQVLLMTHEDGIPLAPEAAKLFKNQTRHDPSDLQEAREIGAHEELFPIGLFYRDPRAERYERASVQGMGMSPEEKLTALDQALDGFTV